MSTELTIALFAMLATFLPGGVVLITLGKKYNQKWMIPVGAIHIGVFSLIFLILLFHASSMFSGIILLLAPFLIIAGLVLWLVWSIVLIVNGFKVHSAKRITIGFILLGVHMTFVITPILLISVFGLPIALM